MIIVEGPDCVGKTTLCHKLVKMLRDSKYLGTNPYLYSHLSRLPDSWRHPVDYYPLIERFRVQDRLHWSEWCYSYARNEMSPLRQRQFDAVTARVRSVGGIVVLITCENQFILQHHSHKEEMYPVATAVRAAEAFRFSQANVLPDAHTFRINYGMVPPADLQYHVDENHTFPAQNEKFVDTLLRVYASVQKGLFT